MKNDKKVSKFNKNVIKDNGALSLFTSLLLTVTLIYVIVLIDVFCLVLIN